MSEARSVATTRCGVEIRVFYTLAPPLSQPASHARWLLGFDIPMQVCAYPPGKCYIMDRSEVQLGKGRLNDAKRYLQAVYQENKNNSSSVAVSLDAQMPLKVSNSTGCNLNNWKSTLNISIHRYNSPCTNAIMHAYYLHVAYIYTCMSHIREGCTTGSPTHQCDTPETNKCMAAIYWQNTAHKSWEGDRQIADTGNRYCRQTVRQTQRHEREKRK